MDATLTILLIIVLLGLGMWSLYQRNKEGYYDGDDSDDGSWSSGGYRSRGSFFRGGGSSSRSSGGSKPSFSGGKKSNFGGKK